MNRNEFMERLEYLLSDIPQEEKADAIAYYRDYLEEAGDDAGKAIQDFGSPERIAAMIRSELAGNLEDGGEFTERGYEDERFRDPSYQVAKRLDLPEEGDKDPSGSGWQQASGGGFGQGQQGASQKDQGGGQRKFRTSGPLKIVLWVILFFVMAPILVGVGGTLTGLFAGALGLLVGLIVLLAVLTVALLLAGAGLCVVGILAMVHWVASGLLMFGAGVVVIGLGLLSLMVSILFYGKFIPWLIRAIVDALGRLVHGRRKEKL